MKRLSIYAFLLKVLLHLASFVADAMFWQVTNQLVTSLLINFQKLFFVGQESLGYNIVNVTHHDHPFLNEDKRP